MQFIFISTSNIGNVYIADCYNNRIRKVTAPTGIITTIAGTGSTTFSGDNGAATSATLYYPEGVALDASGRAHAHHTLYFCDFDLHVNVHRRQRVHRRFW